MLDVLAVQDGNGVPIGDTHDTAFQGCSGNWQRKGEKQGGKNFHQIGLDGHFRDTVIIYSIYGNH